MTILVIGGGKMGMSHLALATKYIGKSNIALCDTKLSIRFLFRILGYKTVSSVDAALSNFGRIDGVIIATPTSSHALLASWAIKLGIPVFIEKPLTLDVNQSNELKALAELNDSTVQIGFVMRYVASFQRVRLLIIEGVLGKVYSYTASMRGNVITKPPSPNSWQGNFIKGGGCLNEYGPHIIDLCCFIFGKVNTINSAKYDQVFCSKADDRVNVAWIHENSIPGELIVDWCDLTKRKSVIEIRINFEYGDLRVDNSTIEINWHEGAKISPEEKALIEESIFPLNVGFYLRGEEFSLELEDFLGSCFKSNFHVDSHLPSGITPRLVDGVEVDSLIDKIARKVGLK